MHRRKKIALLLRNNFTHFQILSDETFIDVVLHILLVTGRYGRERTGGGWEQERKAVQSLLVRLSGQIKRNNIFHPCHVDSIQTQYFPVAPLMIPIETLQNLSYRLILPIVYLAM